MKKFIQALLVVSCFSVSAFSNAAIYTIEDDGDGVISFKIRFSEFIDSGILDLTQTTFVDLTFSVLTENYPTIDNFDVIPESGFLTESAATLGNSLVYSFSGVLAAGTYDFSITGEANKGLFDWGFYTVKGSLLTDPNAIPIPASIWLLFSSLLGFLIVGHRRQPETNTAGRA